MSIQDIIEGATPGPWHRKGLKSVDADKSFPGAASHHHIVNCCSPWGGSENGWEAEARANARFIATFDPEHVALMEAVIEAARSARIPCCPEPGGDCSGTCSALNEYEVLELKLAALDAYREASCQE